MKLRLKNFRCFRDTGFLKLKKITLLVGENSSGKTSFLAGLNHISGLLTDEDVNLNSPPFELGSFKDIFHTARRRENDPSFEYESEIDGNKYRWLFEDDQGDPRVSLFSAKFTKQNIAIEINLNKQQVAISLSLTPRQKALLKQMGARFEQSDEESTESERFYIQIIDRLSTSERFSSTFNFRKIIWHLDREYFDFPRRQFQNRYKKGPKQLELNDFNEDDFKFFQDISQKLFDIGHFSYRPRSFPNIPRFLALSPLRTEPSRVYSFAQSQAKLTPDGRHIPDKLLKVSSSANRSDKLQNSLQKFGKEAGLFQEITIKKLTRGSNYPFSIMVKTAQGKLSNIIDVGYGVSQILPVIVEIISSRKTQSFLLQQPEVHLHPRAQAAFATLVANLTKEKKQFVIETHSDFILERLKYEIEQGNIAPDDVSILFFDTEGNDTKIHQIGLGKDGLPKDPPRSYRKFFLEELDRVWP